MKSAVIHGVLLAVMLVYGYRTWTRDKSVKPDLGQFELWTKDDSDLVAIEFKSERKTVRLERRTDSKDAYWWGIETTIEKRPKPTPPKPPDPKPDLGPGSGSAAGSAAKPADAGSAAKPDAGSAAKGDLPPKKDAGSAAKPDAGKGSGSAAKPDAGKGSAAKPDTGSGSAKLDPGKGSGSAGSAAGSGAGSGSAAPPKLPPPAPPPEMIETTRRREFPLGENGDKLVKAYAEARAIRDLGQPNRDQLIDYKLADGKQLEEKIAELKKEIEDRKAAVGSGSGAKPDEVVPRLQKRLREVEDQKKQSDGKPRTTLTVTFRDGARAFWVGGSVDSGNRYVVDQQSGTAYVMAKDMISPLETGESTLQPTDVRGFDLAKAEGVDIEWGSRRQSAVRITTGDAADKQVKTWGDAATKKPNQPVATFIDNIGNLKPTEYSTTVSIEGVSPLVKLTYKDAGGKALGSVTVYKIESPGVLPDGQELDPANPPKGEVNYYVWTEKTRVPALVRKDTAQRAEQDLPIVFGDVQAPEPKKPATPPLFPPPGGGGGGGHGGHGH